MVYVNQNYLYVNYLIFFLGKFTQFDRFDIFVQSSRDKNFEFS
jgi:hypothetical protein